MIKNTLHFILAALIFCGMAYGFAGKAKPKPEMAWVFSADGSTQCGFEPGKELEGGEATLKKAGIAVEKAQKSNDGAMRVQMCGAPTGSVNAYLIEKAKVPEAEKLGFKTAPEGFPFQ